LVFFDADEVTVGELAAVPFEAPVVELKLLVAVPMSLFVVEKEAEELESVVEVPLVPVPAKMYEPLTACKLCQNATYQDEQHVAAVVKLLPAPGAVRSVDSHSRSKRRTRTTFE
jgi:hypothetical protein